MSKPKKQVDDVTFNIALATAIANGRITVGRDDEGRVVYKAVEKPKKGKK
jgi:hypothetical protein